MRQAIHTFKTQGIGGIPEYDHIIRDLDLAKLLADGEQARRIQEHEDARLESEQIRLASQKKANDSIEFEQKRRVKTQEINDQTEKKKEARRRKNSVDMAIDATERERSQQLDEMRNADQEEQRLRKESIDDVTAVTEKERARQIRENEANEKQEKLFRKKSMDEASQVTEDERRKRTAQPGSYRTSDSDRRVTSSEMIKAQVLRCYTQLRIGCQNSNCCSAHCASNPINAFRLLSKKDAMFQAIMLIKMQTIQLCPETRKSATALNTTSRYYEEIIRNPELALLLGNEEQKRRIQESDEALQRERELRRRAKKGAQALGTNEQNRRIQENESSLQAQEELRRRQQRGARRAAEYEQARRIKEDHLNKQREKKSQIVSEFAATRAAETERRRRMSQDEDARNEEREERRQSIDHAIDLQEKERARQIAENEAKKSKESVSSENARRKDSIDLAVSSVDDEQRRIEKIKQTNIIRANQESAQDRMKQTKKAKRDASDEQARRLKDLEVQVDIEKKTRQKNQMEANKALDAEQQRRISEDEEVQKKEKRQRKESVDMVIALQEEERLRRIAENDQSYASGDSQGTIEKVTAATEEERKRLIAEYEKRKMENQRRHSEDLEQLHRLRQIEKEKEIIVSFEPKRFGFLFQDEMVEDVEKGTQAAELGVRIGFKIISVNGVEDLYDVESILEAIGKTYCANKKTTVTFRAEEYSKIKFEPGQFGMQFQGNRVKKVCSSTQADTKGVQVGAVILSVNGVKQPNNTYTILEAIETSNNANQPTTVTFCLP